MTAASAISPSLFPHRLQNGTIVRVIIRKRQLGYKELRSLGLRD